MYRICQFICRSVSSHDVVDEHPPLFVKNKPRIFPSPVAQLEHHTDLAEQCAYGFLKAVLNHVLERDQNDGKGP